MTASSIDALELLEDQHREILDLFDELAETDDLDDRRELFNLLADKLAAHTSIEEKLFYPTVLTDDTEDMLLEATEAHLAAKRVLADMLELEPDDDHFNAKLAVLSDLVRHHAKDEEEAKLFPLVRESFGADELAASAASCRSCSTRSSPTSRACTSPQRRAKPRACDPAARSERRTPADLRRHVARTRSPVMRTGAAEVTPPDSRASREAIDHGDPAERG